MEDNDVNEICVIGKELTDDMEFAIVLQTFKVPVSYADGVNIDPQNDANDKKLYVLKDFIGEAFERLTSANRPVMGSTAVVQYKNNQCQLKRPSNDKPIHNLHMKDATVCFGRFVRKEDADCILKLVKSMGGTTRRDVSPKVTHLVTQRTSGIKYRKASNYGITVVSCDWIDHVWDNRFNSEFNACSAEVISRFVLKPFNDLSLTFIGFESSELEEMIQLTIANGGNTVTPEDCKCTHFVIDAIPGDPIVDFDFKSVIQKHQHVVYKEWFWASIKIQYRSDESKADHTYYPRVLKTSSKQDKSHNDSGLEKRANLVHQAKESITAYKKFLSEKKEEIAVRIQGFSEKNNFAQAFDLIKQQLDLLNVYVNSEGDTLQLINMDTVYFQEVRDIADEYKKFFRTFCDSAKSGIRKFRLHQAYPDKQALWDFIEDNQDLRIFEIDSEQLSASFIEDDAFYAALTSAKNLLFIDIRVTKGGNQLSDALIKNQLSSKMSSERPLIIQWRLPPGTKTYIKEPSKKPIVRADLEAASEPLNEEQLIMRLSETGSFGIPLLIDVLKSEGGSRFLEKKWDGWKLIDYAVRDDDSVSTRLLLYYDWLLENKNDYGQRTLEIAAEYAGVDTLAALLDLPLPLPIENFSLPKEKAKLLELSNQEGYTPLLIAAQKGKAANVEFLIHCGSNINYSNKPENGDRSIDLAWHNEHYDCVLALLKADSPFPKTFNSNALDEKNDTQKQLKSFVETRDKFHQLIQENKLAEVRKFIEKHKSAFYLNSQGESALLTTVKAIKERNESQESEIYQIYALLSSKRAQFKDKEEESHIEGLNEPQRINMKEVLLGYFSQIDNAHIITLVKISRNKEDFNERYTESDFKEKIKSLYKYLDSIPEISTILQVVQYAGYIDIVFDFNRDSTVEIQPTSSETTKGEHDYGAGRIYIGAKMNNRDEEQAVLGTLAHELTHLVVQKIYNNDCNPYYKSDNDQASSFKKITDEILEKVIADITRKTAKEVIEKKTKKEIKDTTDEEIDEKMLQAIKERINKKILNKIIKEKTKTIEENKSKEIIEIITKQLDEKISKEINEFTKNERLSVETPQIDEIITTVFTAYSPNDWPSELIVRVPHMFAKYGKEKGKTLLSEQVPELFNYYGDHNSSKKSVLHDCKKFTVHGFLINPRNTVRVLNEYVGEINHLMKSDVQFKDTLALNAFLSPKGKSILLLKTKSTWLSSLNVYQALRKIPNYSSLENCLFLKLERYAKHQTAIEKAFYSKASDLLVLIIDTNEQTSEVFDNLPQLFSEKPHKKIILITQESDQDIIKKMDAAGLSNRLEHPDHAVRWNNLMPDVQHQMLEKDVNLQGKDIPLKQLIDENVAAEIIDTAALSELSEGTTKNAVVGHDNAFHSIDWDENYYIQRTFNYQTIKPDVFKSTDLFAVSSASADSLIELGVSPDKICALHEYKLDSDDSIKVILLPDKEDIVKEFQQLCRQYPQRTIHWLQYQQDRLVWQRLQGTPILPALRQYVDESHTIPYQDEMAFSKLEHHHKVVIIAGPPGMGKSTILTSLAHKIKKQFSALWVVRINLNDYAIGKEKPESLQNVNFNEHEIDEVKADKAIDFLLTMVRSKEPVSALGEVLFKACFKHTGKIVVLFDGFDEISPDYKEPVIQLMEVLRKTKVEHLGVTTRFHVSSVLEDRLQVLAYTLAPFSEEDKVEFLTKFWQQNLKFPPSETSNNPDGDNEEYAKVRKNLTESLPEIQQLTKSVPNLEEEYKASMHELAEKISLILNEHPEEISSQEFQAKLQDLREAIDDLSFSAYAKVLLKQLAASIRDRDRGFTNIPLQIRMLAEMIFQVKFKLPEKLGLFDLYQRFIEGKFEIFYKEKKKDNINNPVQRSHNELLKKIVNRKYAHFAWSELFHDQVEFNANEDPFWQELFSDEELSRIGIIQVINNKPHFIHRTYAEYFAADFLISQLEGNRQDRKEKEFLLTNILIKWDYEVIRAFLNGQLTKTLSGSVLKEYGKQIQKLWSKKPNSLRNNYGRTILHITTAEGNKKIARFLLESLKEYPDTLQALINVKDQDNKTALHNAAKYGDLDVVQWLIKNGADVNAKAKDGCTVLYEAAEYGDLDVVEWLVKPKAEGGGGADVNDGIDEDGNTVLHRAALSDKWNLVQWLVMPKAEGGGGADINAKNQHGNTVLHRAALSDKWDLVQWLVMPKAEGGGGADINAKNKHGSTVLYRAVVDCNFDVLKYLLDNGADAGVNDAIDEYGNTVLHWAAEKGNLDIVQWLIKNRADVNAKAKGGHTVLHYAIYSGNLDVVQWLVKPKAEDGGGADANDGIDEDGNTVLHYVAFSGNFDIMQLLIKPKAEGGGGADVNTKAKDGSTVLHEAASSGNLGLCRWLVEKKGADVNAKDNDGRAVLHEVAKYGNLDVVQWLFKPKAESGGGADVNAKTKDDSTVLHEAAKYGNSKLCEWLIKEKGADVDAKDNGGRAVLHEAAKYGNLDVVQWLLKPKAEGGGGADVNVKTKDDSTILHEAVRSGELELVKWMLEKNSEVHYITKQDGIRRIDYITHKSDEQNIVQLLVESGVNVEAVDKYGGTALYYAVTLSKWDVVKYLIKEGADVNLPSDKKTDLLQYAEENGYQDIINLIN